jgi:CubicO group peptidase (beta-lactamase class C family)
MALPPAASPKAAMDASRLALIPERMRSFVEKGTIAGAVTLVARRGEIASLDAVGYQDIEARKPMPKDAIFQIMSMTKPVTGAAIMILAEEGKLSLTDPVEKHLPEFRGQWMIESRDGEQAMTLKKPSRKITIRDLMTHTSGMPTNGPGDRLTGTFPTIREAVLLFSQMPLQFEPGTQWLYSNTGITSLGRIIEVAADMPYEQFVARRIFEPLGMKDSFYFPPEDKHSRIAIPYEIKNGKLSRAAVDILKKGVRNPGPAGGMYSTAADMAQFYQMMLNGGVLNGKRILSKTAVDVMTRNHTGDLKAGHGAGLSFGLTWNVVRTAEGELDLASNGTYSHGGAWGTFGWVDPALEMVGVFMIQRVPGGSREERAAFETIARSAAR